MSDEGIILIALGTQARKQALECIASIQKHSEYPVTVYSDTLWTQKNVTVKLAPLSDNEIVDYGVEARRLKTQLELLTPYKTTLYMDVDCRVRANPELYFDAIADGFDIAIAYSSVQGEHFGQHCLEADREATLDLHGFQPIQLQCGVFAFKRSPAIRGLFSQWRKEYGCHGTHDQLAFLRALYQKPVRLCMLTQTHNNGAVIAHLFGSLKR
jgi:hypothetical protein